MNNEWFGNGRESGKSSYFLGLGFEFSPPRSFGNGLTKCQRLWLDEVWLNVWPNRVHMCRFAKHISSVV
jgi:hypothetical protein